MSSKEQSPDEGLTALVKGRGLEELSSGRFRAMIDALPAAIYTTDAQGRLTHFNPACVVFSGRTPKLGSDHWCVTWKLFYPDGRPMPHDECPMAIALKTGQVIRGSEAIAERPNGTRIWFTPYPTPLFDDAGKVVGGINMLVDITERKAAERAVADRESFTRSVFESGPDCVKVIDVNGSLSRMNVNGMCAMEIDDFAAVAGQTWQDLWPTDGRAQVREALDVARAGGIGRFEGFCPTFKGTPRWWDVSVSPIRDALGNVSGFVSVSRDITERKQSEHAVREREAELTDFFDSAAIGLHWVGPDGIILRVNQAELDMLGYARDEYVGRHIAEFHVDQPVINDILTRLTCGEKLNDYPARLRCKDGSIRDVSITSSVFFKDGQFIHTRCFTYDVTDRKQVEAAVDLAREEAEAASLSKDNFIATLSHELRTPLTPVLSLLGAWENDPTFPAPMRDDLEMVRRNVDLEARLIDDLLDLTRIARGKLALQLEVLDVRRLLESVVGMYRSEISAKRIDLVMGTNGQSCFVKADPGRLQQAIWNLLKNAVKFTAEGGRIEVSTREGADGRVEILVKDDGIGIAPEMIDRLFTPFEQESVKRYGGLGLGLSITRKILEAQAGTITAHSEGKYRGATFVIALPCVDPPAESTAAAPAGRCNGGSAGDAPGQRSLRVLLVEDHIDTARVLARLLTLHGHEVTTAHTVADAVRTARAGPFDVLVTDIGLPDGTGLDLLRQLRQEHGLRVPAVALTGFGMDEDVTRCLEAGFAAHLTKPVNLVKLEEIVQRTGASSS